MHSPSFFDFKFERLITKDIVKIVYVFGIALGTIGAVFGVFVGFDYFGWVGIGASLWGYFIFLLLLRLFSENSLVKFQIAEDIKEIRAKLPVVRETSEFRTTSVPALKSIDDMIKPNADPSGVNMVAVNLPGADLVRADLAGEDLSDANLSGADLSFANLTGADLSFANLTGANLTGANLSGANLTGANLEGANLNYADLSGATMPDGTIHD